MRIAAIIPYDLKHWDNVGDLVDEVLQPGNLVKVFFKRNPPDVGGENVGHDMLFIRKSETPPTTRFLLEKQGDMFYYFLDAESGAVEVLSEMEIVRWIHKFEIISANSKQRGFQ